MPPRMYVTAPSYAMNNPAERAKYAKRASMWAEALGWEAVLSPLLSRFQAAGSWAPVALRSEDMRHALQHEVVWAARGGYSAVELIPALLDASVNGSPLLIGYSDITVLHACWAQRGWGARLYGTLGDTLADSRQAESALAALKGQGYRCSSAHEAAAQVILPGSVRAPIFAACLVVLANMVGTPAMPSLRGHILAIEDIDERPYAVDFALHQLHLSSALEGVVGLLGGSFQHTLPAEYSGPTVDQVLAAWAERLNVPTITRLPFGHMDDPMVVLCGVPCDMQAHAGGEWSLTWETKALL